MVSEQFLTDTARYADIVLPATTQLEQFDIMFSWGHLYLSLNQQAIEPLGEAVPNTELFRRLARTMGFDDRQWQRSDEEMASGRLGLGKSGSSGNNDGSSEGEGLGASECRNARDVRAACRRATSSPHRASASSRRRWRRAATSSCRCSAKARTNFRRASRSIRCQPIFHLTRVAGNQRTAGREISAQHDLAEEPRIPQFVLWQSAGSTASRRASRSCLSIRRMPSHGILAREAPFGSLTIAAASKRSRR